MKLSPAQTLSQRDVEPEEAEQKGIEFVGAGAMNLMDIFDIIADMSSKPGSLSAQVLFLDQGCVFPSHFCMS